MEQLPQKAQEFALEYGPKVIGAALILFIGWIVVKIIVATVRKILTKADLDDGLTGFVCSLTNMGLLALVMVTALGKLGVETTSFAAILAAGGLAIGFALQGSLANFAAGVMILFFKPFKLGDYVEGGGTSGSIESISVFSTILKTPDNKKVIVPNAGMTGGNITNYSANPTRRVDMVFGIGYEDDLKAAKSALTDILVSHPKVLKNPAPAVTVLELADSSVNFAVRPWANTQDYWDVYFDVTEAVKLRFDEKGISIPYPQTDVHVIQKAA